MLIVVVDEIPDGWYVHAHGGYAVNSADKRALDFDPYRLLWMRELTPDLADRLDNGEPLPV